MNKVCLFVSVLGLLFYKTTAGQPTSICKLYSPDKLTQCEFGNGAGKNLVYKITYANKEILSWSSLGLLLNNHWVGINAVLKSNVQTKFHEKFSWRLGENDTIENRYNQAVLSFVSGSIIFMIATRIYNGTVAFRYELPKQPASLSGEIKKENTTFNFPENYTLYQYNQESVFTPVLIDTFSKTCDFPATLTNGKYFISLGEAVNANYTKAELKRGERKHSLSVDFVRDSAVRFDGPFQTPWRTISIAKTAIGLHEFSQLNLKLAGPLQNAIPAWIRPGKLIRAQLNTQSGLDCIDFAAKHKFQYIMFDAGWYGAEFRTSSDPAIPIEAIDMQKVIQHGRENGIGVILYVNYAGLRAKIDSILPLYKKWGVSGIKFGFVNGLTQDGITWLASAMKKVSDAGFIFDIHDNYKPTGLSRTFPALLTQEGIRGDENSPDAFHTTVLPFTRFLAGPADFTFCFPNPTHSFSKNLKVSKAQQYALTIIYFSPLQSIFWYGQPNDYTNESEIEFFDNVPTVWNESIYLKGDIGKNISVARRSGTTWFIGNAAGPSDWKEKLNFYFLDRTKKYAATIYEDNGQGGIIKSNISVKYGDNFIIDVKAACGQALIIRQLN